MEESCVSESTRLGKIYNRAISTVMDIYHLQTFVDMGKMTFGG